MYWANGRKRVDVSINWATGRKRVDISINWVTDSERVVIFINWTTGRKWQAKRLDTWQVTQMKLPRQERA